MFARRWMILLAGTVLIGCASSQEKNIRDGLDRPPLPVNTPGETPQSGGCSDCSLQLLYGSANTSGKLVLKFKPESEFSPGTQFTSPMLRIYGWSNGQKKTWNLPIDTGAGEWKPGATVTVSINLAGVDTPWPSSSARLALTYDPVSQPSGLSTESDVSITGALTDPETAP